MPCPGSDESGTSGVTESRSRKVAGGSDVPGLTELLLRRERQRLSPYSRYLRAITGRARLCFRAYKGHRCASALSQLHYLYAKCHCDCLHVTKVSVEFAPLDALSMCVFFDGGLSGLFEGVPVPVRYRGEREPELEEAGAIGRSNPGPGFGHYPTYVPLKSLPQAGHSDHDM